MSDEAEAVETDEEPPKKKSKALLFGLIGAVLLGGGAFYGVFSGMIPLPFGGDDKAEAVAHGRFGDGVQDEDSGGARAALPVAAAFVPLDEIVISLGPDANSKHLKVSLSIEVEPGSEADVEALSPRIVDVINTFLRAVDERQFEIPRAMLRLRAQMLRRVQLVAPQGAVRDVLIQEFVLN